MAVANQSERGGKVNPATRQFYEWSEEYKKIALQSLKEKSEQNIRRELQIHLYELAPILDALSSQLEVNSISSSNCHKLKGALSYICMKKAGQLMGTVEPMLDDVWLLAERLNSIHASRIEPEEANETETVPKAVPSKKSITSIWADAKAEFLAQSKNPTDFSNDWVRANPRRIKKMKDKHKTLEIAATKLRNALFKIPKKQ